MKSQVYVFKVTQHLCSSKLVLKKESISRATEPLMESLTGSRRIPLIKLTGLYIMMKKKLLMKRLICDLLEILQIDTIK